MALINCPECGTEVSGCADAGVKCGCLIKPLAKCSGCGADITNSAAKFCAKCGCPIMPPAKCSGCGADITNSAAKFCAKCGGALPRMPVRPRRSPRAANPADGDDEFISAKKWSTLLPLSFFLGVLGVDRYYAGQIAMGLLKLFTLIIIWPFSTLVITVLTSSTFLCLLPSIGVFIWWLIDLILAATGNFRDGKGKYIIKRLPF